jgi:hypothetical protein
MVNVIIDDSLKLLSKSQKEKIKAKIKAESYDENEILNAIHYAEHVDKKYNNINIEKSDELITVHLICSEQPCSAKQSLKEKLKEKRLELSSTEPKWKYFRNLKAKGVPNLPSPTEIAKQKEEYLKQLDSIRQVLPKDNPFVSYLEMCIN